MNVVRHDRRGTRANRALPYARPKPAGKKSSGWSLGGLFSWLNPLRGTSHSRSPSPDGSENEDHEQRDTSREHAALPQTPHQPLRAQLPLMTLPNDVFGVSPLSGASPATQKRPVLNLQSPQTSSPQTMLGEPPVTPTQAATSSRPTANISPNKADQVAQYLHGKRGAPLNEVEIAGIVAMLRQDADTTDKPEPFRFTASRSTTPTHDAAAGPSSVPFPALSPAPTTGRKMLARNPNGTTRWNGGGSSRPRFASPAFGSTPTRAPLKLTVTPRTDTKRRRVGADAESSTPQKAEKPATPTRNLAPLANGLFPISNAPATAPAISSPLRQGWVAEQDSPPQSRLPRPTRAANLMAELIKEATPPKKKMEIVNPYETASPVKPAPGRAKTGARKARGGRAAAAAERKEKEEVKTQKRQAELSPQAIIEATVPKGSKRSRPPPGLGKSQSQQPNGDTFQSEAPRRSTRLKSPEPEPAFQRVNGAAASGEKKRHAEPTVEEPEEQSPPKRQKRGESVTIEEVDDEESPRGYVRPAEVVEPGERPAKPFVPPALKSFKPKEASKLRYSYNPDGEEKEKEVEKEKAAPPKANGFALTSAFAPAAASPSAPARSASPFAMPDAPASTASPFAMPSAPASAPLFAVPSAPAPAPAPTSAFAPPSVSVFNASVSTAAPFAKPSAPAPSPPPSAKPSAPALAPSLAPTPAASTSALAPPAAVDPKLRAKSAPVSVLPVFEFDMPGAHAAFGAAQQRARDAAFSGLPAFTFDLDAKTKIDGAAVTKTDAAAVTKPDVARPKAEVKAFNWGAAGMKKPTAPASNWTCGVCMVSNDADKDKCIACETAR